MDVVRAARWSNAVEFFVTGAVVAAWNTRVPAVAQRLELSPGALSVAILGLELGAVTGLPLGAVLVARWGSRPALRAGFAVYPTALLGVAAAAGVGTLALSLGLMALANSVVDVGINAQGVALERRHGAPVLAGMHAGHSIGQVAGALAGTAAAAAGVPVWAHFTATAAVGVLIGVGATRHLVDDAADSAGTPGRPAFAWPGRSLRLLALVAFGVFLLDGAAANWSAVHLSDRGAGAGLAASAFTVFAAALAVGRLCTDRLVTRQGRVRVMRAAGALAAGGTLAAILLPGGLGLAGWAILGLGVAAMAPVVLGAAVHQTSLPPPVAIAVVTTVGYLGSFTGPVVIGGLASLSSLSFALGVLAVVSVAVTALAGPALRRQREPSAR